MPLGPLIRRLFGRYEHEVADAYRRIYIDLNDFAARLKDWAPAPRRILEVGCGEGAMTERLAAAYANATILAIDIAPSVGRLFRGEAAHVTFAREPLEAVADREPGSFELVVLCDVLHHVRLSDRRALLAAIGKAMAPGAVFVFKEWLPTKHPIHWLCHFMDRYVTGDDVCFCTRSELEAQLQEVFGAGCVLAEARIAPWPNNLALVVRR